MVEGIALRESHDLYSYIRRCIYANVRDHRDLLAAKVCVQSAIGIKENQFLQPETRRIYEIQPVHPTFHFTQDILGIIEYSISEHELACDLSATDFLRSEMMRVSKRGSRIVGPPDKNNMVQGEAYKSTETRAHREIIAQEKQ